MARPEPFLSSPGHEKTPVASVPFPATFVEEVSGFEKKNIIESSPLCARR
jgi:hypothetical protein